jgi:hypothetical protein
VVMVSWFSLSSWEVTPRTVKGAGFQTHGLPKFEFKAWIISSASVFHKTLCRRGPLESNCLMIPVVMVSTRYTLRPVRMWVRLRRARLRDFSTESLIRIRVLATSNRKPPLRHQEKPKG